MHLSSSNENDVKNENLLKNMSTIWRAPCASHLCFILGLNKENGNQMRKFNKCENGSFQEPFIFFAIRYYQSWANFLITRSEWCNCIFWFSSWFGIYLCTPFQSLFMARTAEGIENRTDLKEENIIHLKNICFLCDSVFPWLLLLVWAPM